ncbi:thiamine pyrophosphate-dependent enzyme [Saccharopolyspora spinosa]|uniref:thiamine pyrophosphate-dependent enzyme n=1 Tax=Saccharopolyspora spinosa TaxID=60894 RepID=UPI0002378ECA|nr:thiamine pyrophosphate-dependent enzyme [Saccharopolyspora spinosa]
MIPLVKVLARLSTCPLLSSRRQRGTPVFNHAFAEHRQGHADRVMYVGCGLLEPVAALPAAMMAEIFGRRSGSCNGKGGSMHIADLSKDMLGANGIVGGGPPLICGMAVAGKLAGDGAVSVAFFG